MNRSPQGTSASSAKSVTPPQSGGESEPIGVDSARNKSPNLSAIRKVPTVTPPKIIKSRTDEARQCHNKAKLCLSNSRNLKTDLKEDITKAVERLFQLVKEAEAELAKHKGPSNTTGMPINPQTPEVIHVTQSNPACDALSQQLEENSRLLKESIAKMDDLKSSMETQRESCERAVTYAGVVAGSGKPAQRNRALHSVVVTSTDETETGDEVLEKIRKTLDAKEGWVKVERIRKAKDRKVIIGFETTEEREKAKNKMEQESAHLSVEEMKNRDPLLILRDVLKINTDEDIVRALKNQNRDVFQGFDAEEDRIEVKYKRKARNPLTCHVVVGVSPKVWNLAIGKGRLHIDLQQIRVEDQSPLVQCTRCLGYGHSKRFCKEPEDLCSHCGGPHLSVECPSRTAGETPTCRNCIVAKFSSTSHNAFSNDCPVRRKWDQLARSTVAYC